MPRKNFGKKTWGKKNANGFRSGFEYKISQEITDAKYKYEATKIPYVLEQNYVPDWIDEKRKLVIEAKGRFTGTDRRKMKSVKDQNSDWTYLIVLQQPNAKLNKSSKTSLADWCVKNGFLYCTIDTLKETLAKI